MSAHLVSAVFSLILKLSVDTWTFLLSSPVFILTSNSGCFIFKEVKQLCLLSGKDVQGSDIELTSKLITYLNPLCYAMLPKPFEVLFGVVDSRDTGMQSSM